MKFKYILCGGCGHTIVELNLQDNMIFTMIYNDTWMSHGKIELELSGKYKNSGNNYYYLSVDIVVDKLTTEIYDPEDHLNFEFVTLTSEQTNNVKDSMTEFLSCANASLFNNKKGTFDAILYYNPESYDDCCNRENKKVKRLVDSIKLIKLYKIIDCNVDNQQTSLI